MSTPIDLSTIKPLQAVRPALVEILSAESSLNMRPDIADGSADVLRVLFEHLLTEVQLDALVLGTGKSLRQWWAEHRESTAYTSGVDRNAAHAVEHLRAAFAIICELGSEQERLKTQVYLLVKQLREISVHPRIKTWLDDPE